MVIKNGKIDCPVGREYLAKIGLVSDIHVGYTVWNTLSLKSVFEKISAKNIDFCFSLGDTIDSGYISTKELMETQLKAFEDGLKGLNKPIFKIKGNHDTDVSYFTEFGTITFNGFKFICIFPKYISMNLEETSTNSVNSRGRLDESDIEWISNELANSEGYTPIILSHYCIHLPSQEKGSSFCWNICDVVSADTNPSTLNGGTFDGHRDELIELCRTYNVPLFLNGHEHSARLQNGVVDDLNMVNVQIGAMASNYTILTIYADKFLFEQYDSTTDEKIKTLEIER